MERVGMRVVSKDVLAVSAASARSRLEMLRRNKKLTTSDRELARIADALRIAGDSRGLDNMLRLVNSRKDLPATQFTYLNLIRGALESEKHGLKSAVVIYSQMVKRDITPNLVTYSILMTTLTNGGKPELAVNVFMHLTALKVKPNVELYNNLLSAYGKLKNLRKVRSTLKEMKEQEIDPDVVTFTTVIDIYVRAGDAAGITRTMLQIQESGIELDERAWISLVSATCKLQGAKYGEEIILDEPRATVEAWNLVIGKYALEKKQQDSGRLFLQMVDKGIKPNLKTFYELMRVCSPDVVLKQMDSHNLDPTGDTFAVLFYRFAIHRNFKAAQAAEKMMISRGVEHTDRSRNALSYAYATAGKPNAVRRLVQDRRDLNAYNDLLLAFCAKGDMDKAFRVFRVLIKNHEPNRSTFSHLIQAHCRENDSRGAELAFQELMLRKLPPSYRTLEQILQLRLREKDTMGALSLYDVAMRFDCGIARLRSQLEDGLRKLNREDLVQKLPLLNASTS